MGDHQCLVGGLARLAVPIAAQLCTHGVGNLNGPPDLACVEGVLGFRGAKATSDDDLCANEHPGTRCRADGKRRPAADRPAGLLDLSIEVGVHQT